jgi:transcription initiation factor TFIIH subunit 2
MDDHEVDPNEQIRNSYHRWEHTGKSWDLLVDVGGHLIFATDRTTEWESESSKRRQTLTGFVRGLIRSFVVIIDLSPKGLAPRDFGTPRIRLITDHLKDFFSSFLDQNPLSQMAIVTTSDYRAVVQSPLSGNLRRHLDFLTRMSDLSAGGEPSLFNSIGIATKLFGAAPRYSTREILVVFGSMSTCDPKPIDALLTLVTQRQTAAVVSAISFGARIQVLERIAETTGGLYRVPQTPEQFADLLATHIHPPVWSDFVQRMALVPFGFAKAADDIKTFDVSGVKIDTADATPVVLNSICPKCGTAIATVPCYCPCCGLLLMAPAHLTRSLHHLRPLDDFVQADINEAVVCLGCNETVKDGVVTCVSCGAPFCKACDQFLHDCLQNCPGCLGMTARKQ